VRRAPDAVEPRRYLAIALTDSGRPQEAVRHLRRALAVMPGSLELKQELARAERSVRATRDIERLNKELSLQPNSARLHYDLAGALLAGGQTDKAIVELHKALQLEPDFPAAKRKLEQAEQARKR
jgi:predicted Zn-dependent protease